MNIVCDNVSGEIQALDCILDDKVTTDPYVVEESTPFNIVKIKYVIGCQT